MLNNISTKIIFALFIAVLMQALFLVSTSITETALASGGGSSSGGSDSGGSSDGDDCYSDCSSYDRGVSNVVSQTLDWGADIGETKIFSGGNVGITSGGSDYFASVTGGTRFYDNGDGTYNTITYTGTESSSESSSDNNYNPPPTGCPAGTTYLNGTCCPNQYLTPTYTTGKKGEVTTSYTCNVPPPPPPPPPTPPTATISQSKATTETNESFTITYGRSGGGSATSCLLQRQAPGGSYTQIHSNSGNSSNVSQSLNTPGTYGYRSQCYGAGGTSAWSSLSHTVVVPPPTLSFTADQYTIPYNTATTLRWTSQHTDACTADGAWSGSKATNGSEATNNLTTPTTYLLQCHNSYNQSTNPSAVIINLEYGTGADIEVDPSIVHKNDPVTVTWNTGTSDPANCRVETGSVVLQSPLTSTSGSFTHNVVAETTFTINCEDSHNTDDARVNVLPEFQET